MKLTKDRELLQEEKQLQLSAKAKVDLDLADLKEKKVADQAQQVRLGFFLISTHTHTSREIPD